MSERTRPSATPEELDAIERTAKVVERGDPWFHTREDGTTWHDIGEIVYCYPDGMRYCDSDQTERFICHAPATIRMLMREVRDRDWLIAEMGKPAEGSELAAIGRRAITDARLQRVREGHRKLSGLIDTWPDGPGEGE